MTARRAILRKPIDRIGYGGYLKLALDFPEFLDYVESVCNEFRELYENAKGATPYCVKKVAVLNSWGKIRSWGCHMVHHALYQKQNYSYAGIIEALSGAPFDVKFISFDDILKDKDILKDIDVIINVGDGDTAHTGGAVWENAVISAAIREFVYRGGGFIGVGEPAGHQYQGHYLQLADLIGVEKETGFTLNYDKYNWEEHKITLFLQIQQSLLTSERARRICLRMREQKFWYRGTKKFRWLCMNLARAVRSISVDCHIALRTAEFFIEAFCGVHMAKVYYISGLVQISMWKYMHM